MDRLGDSVERELSRSGGGAAAPIGAAVSVWPRVVGETVARNAWPLRIGRDGTLHVAATSSTWAFELDRLAPDILEKLARELGEGAPAKLRFAVGPVPEPGADESTESPVEAPPSATPETSAEAATAAAEIEDPELRELALRAALASLSRSASDRSF
jgi:hypothetical protein